MADNGAPRARPVLIQGTWLAGFIKKSTVYCYTQNMKAPQQAHDVRMTSHRRRYDVILTSCARLVVSEKKIFYLFITIVSLWELMTPACGHI